ncbi:MAG: hypothetical protein AAF655_19630, partial [Bacteroidota bacterium]
MTLSTDFVWLYLMEEMGEEMGNRNYLPISAKQQFRRTDFVGFQNCLFNISTYEDVIILEVQLGIRIQEVEDIVFPYTRSSLSFKNDSHTLLISQAKLIGTSIKRYKVRDVYELDYAIHQLNNFLWSQGFPFLDENRSLAKAESLLNAHPRSPSLFFHNQFHRCLKGITAAYLIKRPDRHKLADIYASNLKKLPAVTI